jgi:hypothetical protein
MSLAPGTSYRDEAFYPDDEDGPIPTRARELYEEHMDEACAIGIQLPPWESLRQHERDDWMFTVQEEAEDHG